MVSATSPQQRARPSQRASRFLFRNRRLLAALLFCLASATAVEALIPPDPTRVNLVAAAIDLPVGTVLTAEKVIMTDLPPEAAPSRSFADLREVLGEQLATPLVRGDILTESFFVGSGLLAGAPPDTVAVPVRPADPSTVQLVSPGQHVEVVLSAGNGFDQPAKTTVLARGLPVLWTSASSGGGASGSWPGAVDSDGLVVVAADPADAAALAGASSSGSVHLVLTGAPP
ncbi:Flp pilus assembly protein CpaB [Arthrobacter sp. H20]|uniref:Flp pilus assembly protein CpaB n=1 Tax=Arthrobacter sp. H20 TaxID=1267981 RepID=UPI0004B08E44|nr:Flp pilus assembly protein CpaB [Arthrobacter sp. H20]